jgi:uncharacterized membrane protein (UPF0136 family)
MYILISLYALLLFIGGFIGYFKAASLPSLLMGLISTILLILFTLLYRNKALQWAGSALLITVLALDSFFTWRFIKTFSLFPSGFFSLFSTILLIVIALKISKKTNSNLN